MKSIEYSGMVFDSLVDLFRAVKPPGMNYMCLRRRLASGWDIDRAISTPVATHSIKSFEYKGLVFKTVMELYRTLKPVDMSYMCFRNRLGSGWDIERAISTPVLAAWRRTYTVDGVNFDSLKALADAAGISYMSAVKRAQRGMSDAEIFYGHTKQPIITKPKNPPVPRGKSVEVEGKKYENLQQAFNTLKPSITFNAARQRIRRGQSIEDAFLLTGIQDGRSVKVRDQNLVIDGVRLTSEQASKQFGVPQSTIRDRKARGASDAQTVGLAPIAPGELKKRSEAYIDRRPIQRNTLDVAGVEYESITALAKAYGLDHALVYNRIKVYGWNPERAVKEPVAEPATVDGVTYRSAQAAWEKIGETAFSLFSARRAEGMDVRVCLGIDPLPPRERYEIDGKTYSNLDGLAEAYNLSPGQLSGRLRTMTIEEAVNYRPIHGRYTSAKFRADPELAARQASLYFVSLEAKDGQLHKIGITTRTTKARFHRSKHKTIALWSGTLEAMYKIEQEILQEFAENHYRAEDEFDGRTETFIFLPEEEARVVQRISEKITAQERDKTEHSTPVDTA